VCGGTEKIRFEDAYSQVLDYFPDVSIWMAKELKGVFVACA